MKLGMKNIYKDGQFGMSILHMEAFRQTAVDHNNVIGVRPVSKFALSFIENGYPTKPFIVKNKTANIGIAAGLIAMDPKYTQVSEVDYKKYSDLFKKALENDSELQCIPLTLTENRIQELKKYFGEEIHLQITTPSLSISWRKENTTIRVIAKKNLGNNNFSIFDENDIPLQVLGKKIKNVQGIKSIQPVTADYDLLVICPAYEDHKPSGEDRTPFSTQDSLQKIHTLIQASLLPNYVGPKEDTKGGNWSERTRKMITKLNENIVHIDSRRKGDNLETIHHNTEFNNPFACDLKYNLPCLIILPKPMDLSSLLNTKDEMNETIILIETQEELKKICQIVYKHEYYWPAHAKYPNIA